MQLNPEQRIAKATQNTKWEGELYLVGGCVRDPLLGEPKSPDIDIVLEGSAIELAKFLRKKKISDIKPAEFPRFGTALIRVDGVNVELASTRADSYQPESRKPIVRPATLEQDAFRRDFTINAVYKNLHSGELCDPTKRGLRDLRGRTLRTPKPPKETFFDDPLRMLRAVRFKNRFGLTPARGLTEAICSECGRIEIVSKERIKDELIKMLAHASAAESMRDLMELGLLEKIIPELAAAVGVSQGSFHKKDVWNHTLDVVANAAKTKAEGEMRTVVMLGALLHDVAKPFTRSIEPSGRVRFFGHERTGAQMTRRILKRLRFPARMINQVCAIVENHMRLGSAVPFTKSAARRLHGDLGDLVEPLLIVCQADARAVGRVAKGIDFRQVRRTLAEVTKQGDARFESPLTGEDIMRILRLNPGPEVGRIKRELREAVLEGVLKPSDAHAAKEWLRKRFK